MKHPLSQKLREKDIILASGSPRRKELLTALGLDFRVEPRFVEEIYPEHLQGAAIAEYLAQIKASPFVPTPNQIIITSDTVVWHRGTSLAKPVDAEEAKAMLMSLSGDWHEVISSLCITQAEEQWIGSASTRVKFSALSREEIDFYIEYFKPFDKAGAYGIQEWIGMVGIEEMVGSYFNVVGLPVHLLHQQLSRL